MQRGMQCIKGLPGVRAKRRDGVVSRADLTALIELLMSYLNSPKKNAPPSKKILHAAASSLLQAGVVLSQKWDKTQLALVVQKWAVTALRLSDPSLQHGLFVEALVSPSNPKALAHKCCLKDEASEEVVSLSIVSPSPVKAASTSPSPGESGSQEFGGEEFDNDFLAEIDAIAEQADLANIPVHFYTPRVLNNQHGNRASPGQFDLRGTHGVLFSNNSERNDPLFI